MLSQLRCTSGFCTSTFAAGVAPERGTLYSHSVHVFGINSVQRSAHSLSVTPLPLGSRTFQFTTLFQARGSAGFLTRLS